MYLFLKRNSNFERNYAGNFDVCCGIFSNILSDCDTDSENVNLKQSSVTQYQMARKHAVGRVYH